MQRPLVAPAPRGTTQADAFRDLFEPRCQFRHSQPDLTGLMVLENKSLATIACCVLERADNTTRSRCLSEAPWVQDHVNDRRGQDLLAHTTPGRGPTEDAALLLDETLGEPAGSLGESARITMARPPLRGRTTRSPAMT